MASRTAPVQDGRSRRGRRLVDAALVLAIVVLVAIAASVIVPVAMSEGEASSLRGEMADGGLATVTEENPDVAAWVRVEGTPIDLPVMALRDSDPDGFYLSHGVDRTDSLEGVPFLDRRCTADGQRVLVYGHHMLLMPQAVFSPVYDAWRQSSFDGIGDLVWSTPAAGTVRLKKVMAMKVDKTYSSIQELDATETDALREWATGLLADADAKADGAEGTISSCERVVTLVTCSNRLFGGQRERTLLVFAG